MTQTGSKSPRGKELKFRSAAGYLPPRPGGIFRSSNDIAVDTAANEVFVADGYGNRRVAVFDSETGAYKRHSGE